MAELGARAGICNCDWGCSCDCDRRCALLIIIMRIFSQSACLSVLFRPSVYVRILYVSFSGLPFMELVAL